MFLLWFSFIELTITWYKSRVWGISCSYYTLHDILSRSRYMCHSWDVNVNTSRFSTFVFLWRFIAIIFFSRLHCFCALCYHTQIARFPQFLTFHHIHIALFHVNFTFTLISRLSRDMFHDIYYAMHIFFLIASMLHVILSCLCYVFCHILVTVRIIT